MTYPPSMPRGKRLALSVVQILLGTFVAYTSVSGDNRGLFLLLQHVGGIVIAVSGLINLMSCICEGKDGVP